MAFTSYDLKRRPDQTVYALNDLATQLAAMKNSIRVVSEDKSSIIIIGTQPIDPNTKKPYPFGIHTYKVKGDRLELIS